MVICPGQAQMASDWIPFAKVLNEMGLDVLVQRLPGLWCCVSVIPCIIRYM